MSDSDYSEEPESDAEDEASDSDYSEEPKRVKKTTPAAGLKRAREEPPAAALSPVAHTRASLAALSPAELLDVAESLAKRVRVLESKGTFPAKENTAPPQQSAEAVQAQLAKVLEVAVKGIKAQLKWRQSCKHGTARFSYDALISAPVAVALFKAANCLAPKEERQLLAADGKGVAKKMARDAFEKLCVGDSWRGFSVSIRYGSLSLTGDTVLVRFNSGSGELKITGCYGV